MGIKSKYTVKESDDILQSLYKKQHISRVKLRVKCLQLTKSKKFSSQKKLAIHLGLDYATIKRWLKQYGEEGIDSYLSIKSGGNRQSIINQEIHTRLSDRLHDSKKSFKGYWDVQNWIKQEFGLDMKYNTVRTYLIRHFKTKLKTPRKSHYKKDEQAIEAFLKTTK